VFETAECEEVRNTIFWELRYEKHENQMKGCGVELKLSDWQMNAWISLACDTVKARRRNDNIIVIRQQLKTALSARDEEQCKCDDTEV